LGFAPREQGVRGQDASVIRKNPADFVRNTFELRLKNAVFSTRGEGGLPAVRQGSGLDS